jgi:hypothetical protein
VGNNDWQTHLNHDRFVRDLMVKLGFCTPPKYPDTDGCFVSAGPIRVFHGLPFWKEMEKSYHDSIRYDHCKCGRK